MDIKYEVTWDDAECIYRIIYIDHKGDKRIVSCGDNYTKDAQTLVNQWYYSDKHKGI